MKFVLLIYGDRHAWSNMSADEVQRHGTGHRRFREAAGAAVLATHEFAPANTAGTFRSRSGALPEMTDGPYVRDSHELGGYYLLEVPGRDEAVRLASLLPEITAKYRAGVEIRPIRD